MSVKVINLTKEYGTQKAVNNISFEVEKGEVVGFLGPNGAGKSTTMKMLTCYILPTSGEAYVCGKDVYEQSMEVRKYIGYLPEHNPLYHEMYVKEYLEFAARTYGIHKNKGKRINELIGLTGLDIEKHKKIGQLSKGYRQRVGLAQALLHDPKVLILDEPTSGLDPNQIVEIRNLIKAVGKEKTVILSTHIMQEVQNMCSRVIIINRGEIVADDPVSVIVNKHRGSSYIRVIFKNRVEAIQLKKIPGVLQAEPVGDSWLLQTDSNYDLREAIYSFAVSSQNIILEMNKEEGNLEQVFQQLTQKEIKQK